MPEVMAGTHAAVCVDCLHKTLHYKKNSFYSKKELFREHLGGRKQQHKNGVA